MSLDGHGLILVIDDDEAIREMLCLLLELEGYRAMGCRDGTDGLAAARRLHPSLITLDLQMPGMRGEEVLEKLALDVTTASIPVVIISAYPMASRTSANRQVRAVLRKPFDNSELLKRISGAWNGVAA